MLAKPGQLWGHDRVGEALGDVLLAVLVIEQLVLLAVDVLGAAHEAEVDSGLMTGLVRHLGNRVSIF